MSALRILGFLLSNLDFTRFRRVKAHDFGLFLLVWVHSVPNYCQVVRGIKLEVPYGKGVRRFTSQQLMIFMVV
jgi:hypothetical protein